MKDISASLRTGLMSTTTGQRNVVGPGQFVAGSLATAKGERVELAVRSDYMGRVHAFDPGGEDPGVLVHTSR